MVTIIDYKHRQSADGKDFFTLLLEGQPEFVKSITTNRLYMTAKRASILTTFNEETCKSLMGSKFPGSIVKVECEEYDYTIPETNEVIKLDFRYEYSDEPANVEEAVFNEVAI